jgi:hypothetical protein
LRKLSMGSVIKTVMNTAFIALGSPTQALTRTCGIDSPPGDALPLAYYSVILLRPASPVARSSSCYTIG